MSDFTRIRPGAADARAARLGAALRANLQRRKAQARARSATAGDAGPDTEPGTTTKVPTEQAGPPAPTKQET